MKGCLDLGFGGFFGWLSFCFGTFSGFGWLFWLVGFGFFIVAGF